MKTTLIRTLGPGPALKDAFADELEAQRTLGTPYFETQNLYVQKKEEKKVCIFEQFLEAHKNKQGE